VERIILEGLANHTLLSRSESVAAGSLGLDALDGIKMILETG
jgi:hypothetical protein